MHATDRSTIETELAPPMPPLGARARRTRVVEAADIVRFTAMTGDANPVHYDPELAARSRFGEIIVQGGVTTGLLNAVVAEDLPGPGSVFLETNWRYLAPVRPGDRITAEVEVIGRREDKPIVRLRTTITDQDDRIVIEGEAAVWRDPAVAASRASRLASTRRLKLGGEDSNPQ